MSIVKRVVGLAVVACALALFLVPRNAKACGTGMGGGGYAVVAVAGVAGLGLLGTDVGFGVYDIVKAGQGKHASKGMAIAEVAITSPQLAVVGWYLTSSYIQKTTTGYVISAIPTALFLHGVITLISVDWSAEQAEPPPDGAMLVHPYAPTATPKSEPTMHAPEDRLRVSIAPTMLPGGTPDNPTMIPGLGAWGSF